MLIVPITVFNTVPQSISIYPAAAITSWNEQIQIRI